MSRNLTDMGNDKILEWSPIYFELRTNQNLTGFTSCVPTCLYWNVLSYFKPFIGVSMKQFLFKG